MSTRLYTWDSAASSTSSPYYLSSGLYVGKGRSVAVVSVTFTAIYSAVPIASRQSSLRGLEARRADNIQSDEKEVADSFFEGKRA